MNQLTTTAIVLARTDYGEADRILTLLTPESGKLRLMAKGVRKIKSKLAGGIELFSTSDITYIRGRGEIGTLVSSRLIRHYGDIVQDVTRTMLGYELLKQVNRATEDEPEQDYYHLMEAVFASLADPAVPVEMVRTWFQAQLLRLGGHTPNLRTATDGSKLQADRRYEFSFDDTAFTDRPDGTYAAADIKFMRLLFSNMTAAAITRVDGHDGFLERTRQLVQILASSYVRV